MAQQAGRPAGFQYTTQDLFLGFSTQTRPSADLRLRPTPTLETQELYDTMKQMEHELDLNERIRLQGGHGIDHGQGDLLEPPPTPSLTTTISRSPSLRSRTQSVTYSAAPVDIAEVVEQEERLGTARRRAVRHGPLDKYTKARAALLRKLGACDSCRERKVKCTHHDLSEFERNYQGGGQLRKPISPHSSFLPSPFQVTHQLPSSNSEAFLHIGGHIASSLPSVLQYPEPNEQDGPAAELERMLQAMTEDSQLPMPASSAPLYGEVPFSREASLYVETRQRRALAPWSSPAAAGFGPASTAVNAPFIEPNDYLLPICRLVDGAWECQWSDGSDSSETNSEAEVCGLRHPRLASLSTHFRSAHTDFREGRPPIFFWICSKCRLKWIENAEECPQENCSGRKTFEQWYFGQVGAPPMRSSPSSIQISSHDSSPMQPGAGTGGAPLSGPYTASPSASSSSMNRASGFWGVNTTLQLQYFEGTGSARPVTPENAPELLFQKWPLLCLPIATAVSYEMAHRFLDLLLATHSFYLAWAETNRHGVLEIPTALPVLGAASSYAVLCAAVGLVAVRLYKHAKYIVNQTTRVGTIGVATA
ncbi:hypothetical protein GQ53DRAFT_400188 [Thozetella sp. PMI_491]|nr:hypothetical protein GQ53DRAFT_400188 [Thozetella sp. PMI_491]